MVARVWTLMAPSPVTVPVVTPGRAVNKMLMSVHQAPARTMALVWIALGSTPASACLVLFLRNNVLPYIWTIFTIRLEALRRHNSATAVHSATLVFILFFLFYKIMFSCTYILHLHVALVVWLFWRLIVLTWFLLFWVCTLIVNCTDCTWLWIKASSKRIVM